MCRTPPPDRPSSTQPWWSARRARARRRAQGPWPAEAPRIQLRAMLRDGRLAHAPGFRRSGHGRQRPHAEDARARGRLRGGRTARAALLHGPHDGGQHCGDQHQIRRRWQRRQQRTSASGERRQGPHGGARRGGTQHQSSPGGRPRQARATEEAPSLQSEDYRGRLGGQTHRQQTPRRPTEALARTPAAEATARPTCTRWRGAMHRPRHERGGDATWAIPMTSGATSRTGGKGGRWLAPTAADALPRSPSLPFCSATASLAAPKTAPATAVTRVGPLVATSGMATGPAVLTS